MHGEPGITCLSMHTFFPEPCLGPSRAGDKYFFTKTYRGRMFIIVFQNDKTQNYDST